MNGKCIGLMCIADDSWYDVVGDNAENQSDSDGFVEKVLNTKSKKLKKPIVKAALTQSAALTTNIDKRVKMWNFQRKKRLLRESNGKCIDSLNLYGKTLLVKRRLVMEHDPDNNKMVVSLPSS